MLDVNFVPDAESAAQAVVEVASAAGVLKHAVQAVPAGTRATPAHPDRRREAYLAFQKAALRTFSHSNYMAELAAISRRPILFGGVWGSIARLMDALHESSTIQAELLGALAEVRTVGNPAPRAQAELITALIVKLHENLPAAPRKADREARAAAYEKWQGKFGEANKEFTEIAREDLEYAGKPREHWWQWRRPKAREPWPGGWPGPSPELDEPGTAEAGSVSSSSLR